MKKLTIFLLLALLKHQSTQAISPETIGIQVAMANNSIYFTINRDLVMSQLLFDYLSYNTPREGLQATFLNGNNHIFYLDKIFHYSPFFSATNLYLENCFQCVIQNCSINKLASDSCFNNKYIFVQNNNFLDLRDNSSTLFTADEIIFTNNDTLNVIDNNAQYYTFGKFGSLNIVNHSTNIQFTGNTSLNSATLSADVCIIANNTCPISFELNSNLKNTLTADSETGVISAKTLTITNNTHPINFYRNNSFYYGGAVSFINGEINAFSEMTFSENFSKQAGAIYVQDGGSFHLIATSGDIVFYSNRCAHLTTTTTAPNGYLNSFSTGSDTNLVIKALTYQNIMFYDPIEMIYPSTSISFNPEGENAKGMILFSGERCSDFDLTIPFNTLSTFNAPATIGDGVLLIDHHATVRFSHLTQNGGLILLGNDATLSTLPPTTTTTESTAPVVFNGDAVLNLSNVGFNLASLMAPNSSPAKLLVAPQIVDGVSSPDLTGRIILSGAIQLRSLNDDVYEINSMFQAPIMDIELLQIEDSHLAQIDISQLNIQSINSEKHYGFQGNWNLNWGKETIDSIPLTFLQASWFPNYQYIPDPEKQLSLVPNNIWLSFHQLQQWQYSLVNQNINFFDCPDNNASHQSHYYDASSLNFFINQQSYNNCSGYSYRATGYSIKSSLLNSENKFLSGAFAHIFGKSVDKQFDQQIKNTALLGNLTFLFPMIESLHNVIGEVSGSYEFSKHVLSIRAKDLTISKALYQTHSAITEFGAYYCKRFSNTKYFVKIANTSLFHSRLEKLIDFKSTFSLPNYCGNWSIPIGFMSSKPILLVSKQALLTTSAAYSYDIYRKSIEANIYLNKDVSFLSHPAKVNHNAIHGSALLSINLSPYAHLQANYNISARKSTLLQQAEIHYKLTI